MSVQQSAGARDSADQVASPSGSRKPLIIVILALLVFGAALVGHNAWKFNQAHAVTDDAQLTSDLIMVSPQISAQVTLVPVLENQEVKAGDLICQLDSSPLQAAYNQAKANLEAAVAAAQQAGTDITLASALGDAQHLTATGAIKQADSGIDQAKTETRRSESGVQSALAAKDSAAASLSLAKSGQVAANANLQHARDSSEASAAQVATAEASLGSAQSAVDASQAVYERLDHDAARYARLYQEGAMSAQTAENAASAAKQAKAQLESAKHNVAQAQAAIVLAQANLRAARQQIEANAAAVAQSKAQVDAAIAQNAVAAAAVTAARAQLTYAKQGIAQAAAKETQAAGALKQADTSPVQVSEKKNARDQALARIEQAKAALEAARIQLSDTKIVAPISGRISKKSVEPGQYVQPGTPLLTIIPDKDVWVTANYKETQLTGVHSGSPVLVEVDGIPGAEYKAHVDSISAGTGATFALLPPDNSTGNFTKVVQRVAVKIVFEPNQPNLDQLRAGMSVTSTITLR